ncbi:MAG: L,D-transpeptidase family protein [Pseudomonadales bacterium]|nr:L,D-transpeptidase family protein [Pseudomonadales bacterium]
MKAVDFLGALAVCALLTISADRAMAATGDAVAESIEPMVESALSSHRVAGIELPDTARFATVIRALYARRGGAPLWFTQAGLTANGRELLERIRFADQYGLRSGDYRANDIIYRAFSLAGSNADPAEWQALDVALTFTAARFLTHLHAGRIDPRTVGHDLIVPHASLDLATALAALAGTTDIPNVLADYEPGFRHYELLRRALLRYRELAQQPELNELPTLPTRSVRQGDTYAGMNRLRALLLALGDWPESETTATVDSLDATTVNALKRFQARHGLDADGALGPGTFMALTTPFARRVQQIEFALERARWLPSRLDSPPIIVNIPQFKLFAFRTLEDSESDMLHMNVVVGKIFPQNNTPVFAADLRYVVIRPYWDVRRSILNNELLPSIRRNPDWFVRNRFEIVQGQSDTSPVLAPTPENIEALASGAARLRQRPGADNSLGNFKFLFPNVYNVYLHDTPTRGTFARAQRAASHGCVRIEDPRALADQLLANEAGWQDAAARAAQIDAALARSTPTRITLQRPVRVFLIYATALALEDGRVLFFDDIYGHDARLASALAATVH